MKAKNVCIDCGVSVKKGYFRCDPCVEKPIEAPTKRAQPTRSVFKNGKYGADGL